jgi:hypothetical protein
MTMKLDSISPVRFIEIFEQIKVRTRLKNLSPKMDCVRGTEKTDSAWRVMNCLASSPHTLALCAGWRDGSQWFVSVKNANRYMMCRNQASNLSLSTFYQALWFCLYENSSAQADNIIDQRNEPQNAHWIFHLPTDYISHSKWYNSMMSQ